MIPLNIQRLELLRLTVIASGNYKPGLMCYKRQIHPIIDPPQTQWH